MRIVKPGSVVWRRAGVGSGDVACVLNCGRGEKTCLDLWAEIVRKRDLKELPKVRKVQLDQGSPDWLDWRKMGLGGSEVGCVMGAIPYRDSKADRIFERKIGARPEVEDNPAMARGRALEPEARRLYETIYGWTADPICVVHDEYDHVRCSLDGLRPDGKVSLEVKASGARNHEKYLAVSRIADHLERQTAFAQSVPGYRYQCLYQLLITGADCCHFVGYNPDYEDPADRLAIFEVWPEPAEMERLLRRVNEFWKFVETRTPPPQDWLTPCWQLPTEVKVLGV